jgi:hypothetical protein
MLKHYSHIGQEAKWRAVDALVKKVKTRQEPLIPSEAVKESAKVEVLH